MIRLYVGYQWLTAGWHKIIEGFDATKFLQGAVAKAVPASPGAKPVVQAWWAEGSHTGIYSKNNAGLQK